MFDVELLILRGSDGIDSVSMDAYDAKEQLFVSFTGCRDGFVRFIFLTSGVLPTDRRVSTCTNLFLTCARVYVC